MNHCIRHALCIPTPGFLLNVVRGEIILVLFRIWSASTCRFGFNRTKGVRRWIRDSIAVFIKFRKMKNSIRTWNTILSLIKGSVRDELFI
ncbi:hypothetical protein P8452_29380 [Trifolium repens]|nr:hypothetical protein P8452_29380 [Trifolium repens]